MVWNLGKGVLTGRDDAKTLMGPAAKFWCEFNRNSAMQALKEVDSTSEVAPKIKILGGKMINKN